jgi:hypothetical protein
LGSGRGAHRYGSVVVSWFRRKEMGRRGSRPYRDWREEREGGSRKAMDLGAG